MKNEYRISGGSAGLMYGVALMFDGISLIPIIGSIVPVFGSLTFWLWFKMKGVDFNSSRRYVTSISATLIEVVPVINVLPAWTLATFLIVQEVRAEDLLKMQLAKKKQAETAKRKAVEEKTIQEEALPVNFREQSIQTASNGPVEQTQNVDVESEDDNRLQNRVPLREVKVPDTVRKIGRIDYQVNRHLGPTSSQTDSIKTQKNAA